MVLFTELLGSNLGNLVNSLALVHVAALVSITSTRPATPALQYSLHQSYNLSLVSLPLVAAHASTSHTAHTNLVSLRRPSDCVALHRCFGYTRRSRRVSG